VVEIAGAEEAAGEMASRPVSEAARRAYVELLRYGRIMGAELVRLRWTRVKFEKRRLSYVVRVVVEASRSSNWWAVR